MTHKVCTVCLINKPIEDFPFHNPAKGTRRHLCLTCRKYTRALDYVANREEACEDAKEKRKRNPEAQRGYDLKKRFGITLNQFNEIFELQGRKCACCYTTEPGDKQWHVDHDHACCPSGRKTCGKCVRGILCRQCNMSLGNAEDNLDRIRNMARFLEEYRDRPIIEIV